jgi:hypothetical protein
MIKTYVLKNSLPKVIFCVQNFILIVGRATLVVTPLNSINESDQVTLLWVTIIKLNVFKAKSVQLPKSCSNRFILPLFWTYDVTVNDKVVLTTPGVDILDPNFAVFSALFVGKNGDFLQKLKKIIWLLLCINFCALSHSRQYIHILANFFWQNYFWKL